MAREEVTKTERRRRNTDALSGARKRLQFDESKLDRENYVYRVVNDTPGRIQTFTEHDDWDIVQDRSGSIKPDGTGDGAKVETIVGTGAGGAPTKAVLLRKPKAYHDEDMKAKMSRIDATETSLKAGNSPGGDNSSQYVKDIRIDRGD